MKCKYIYKFWPNEGKQCEMEAEVDSAFCFWHKQKKMKDLSSKEIKEKNLQEAYLVGANLSNAKFEEFTNLSFADLREANLWATKLKSANITGANMQRTKLWQVDFQNATLLGADFKNSSTIYSTRQKTYIRLSDLQNQQLKTANFKGVFARGADFKMSNLYDADFKGAYLESADFSESNLERANFIGSHLTGAKFQGANFTQVELKGAFLYKVSLKNIINLRYARIWPAIEEIISGILLDLGKLEERFVDEYWEKFFKKLESYLKLHSETDEDKKLILNSIINTLHGNVITQYDLLQNAGGFLEQAEDIYLNFKNYFREIGLYDNSGKFYVLEQRVKGKIEGIELLLALDFIKYRLKTFIRKVLQLRNVTMNNNMKNNTEVINLLTKPYIDHANTITLLKDIENYFQSLVKLIGNILSSVTSLYGESPLRVILTSIEIIIIFALIYTISGLQLSHNLISHAVGNSLYFSAFTFLTLSYGEISPIPSMRLFAGIEAFFGAFFFAYFVIVVSRKIMR